MAKWGCSIRLAGFSDVDEIVRITNAAYLAEKFCLKGERTDEGDVISRMRTGKFLVIDSPEQHAELAASVYFSTAGERGYLGMLAVDPPYQGGGFAKALILAVEDQCRLARCTDLGITVVNLRKELFPFYVRLGFLPEGIESFPHADRVIQPLHLVKMVKRLPEGKGGDGTMLKLNLPEGIE